MQLLGLALQKDSRYSDSSAFSDLRESVEQAELRQDGARKRRNKNVSVNSDFSDYFVFDILINHCGIICIWYYVCSDCSDFRESEEQAKAKEKKSLKEEQRKGHFLAIKLSVFSIL